MTELSRAVSAPPVRHVHLGLGNFFRAHQAWYTDHAEDGGEWGIAAFTGRSPDLATALAAQDGLYTLVTRAADGDRFELVRSVSRPHAAHDQAALLGYLADPEVQIVTTTVTEAGYVRVPDAPIEHHDGLAYVRYVRSALPPLELAYSKPRIHDEMRTLEPAEPLDPAARWVDLDGEGIAGVFAAIHATGAAMNGALKTRAQQIVRQPPSVRETRAPSA